VVVISMSAKVEINCDFCGEPRPVQRPATWWSLEQQGAVQTTTARDFCTLDHLQQWLADAGVREAYPLDFAATPPGVTDGGV
jgi:hypothetical protein